MKELPKALRREARELLGTGYERLLAKELEKLDADFAAWKSGEIDPFELTDRIHIFHNGPAKALYNRFNTRGLDGFTVAALVVDGTLRASDLSTLLLEELSDDIRHITQGGE